MSKRNKTVMPETSVRIQATLLSDLLEFAHGKSSDARHGIPRMLDYSLVTRGESTTGSVSLKWQPPAEVEEVRRVLAISIRQFLRDEAWTAPHSMTLRPCVWRERSGSLRLDYSAGSWQATFWVIFAQALQAAGNRLRTCPDQACGRIFVRMGRRDHCSTACAQRIRSRRFYEQNRNEVLASRHGAYVRRRRRVHAKAKVLRRPRQR